MAATLSGWSYRCAVTIDNTTGTSALTYYQVPITLSGATYTSWAAHGLSNGNDLRVTDSDGTTLLNFAIERIDATNSKVYLLAKIPSVPAGTSKTIYVYWGNSSAASASDLAKTIGASNAQVGPIDVFAQADLAGYTDNPIVEVLRYQTGSNASRNGDWLVWHAAGKTTNGNYTGVKIYLDRSTNNGSSWTKTQMLAPATGNAVSVRCFGEMLDGTLLLVYTHGTVTNTNNGKVPLYIAKSTDAGATWTNLSTSPTNPLNVPWTVGTDVGTGYGHIRQLTAGGAYYVTVYGYPSAATLGRCFILSCPGASDPINGANWSLLGTIANDGTHNFTEADWTTTSSNSNMIAVMRCDNAPYDLYRCASTDGGATWSAPAPMSIAAASPTADGHPGSPYLLKHSSGLVLVAYHVRQGTKFGSTIRVSADGGATFVNTPGNPLLLHTPSGNDPRDYGMPTIDELADGRIAYTSYYGVTSPNLSNIECAIVDLDYILNGANTYSTCNAFGAPWTTGATDETSIDTSIKLIGTGSILIDNSVGTATNNNAIANLWPSGNAGSANVAMSYWAYIQQQQVNQVAIGIAIESSVGATEKRLSSSVFDDASGGVTVHWFNGSHTDSNVVVNTTEWTKLTYAAATTFTTVAGKAARNNVDTGLSISQYQGGGLPYQARFVVGSTSGLAARKSNIGLVYSHQYTPTPPVVSAGAEQAITSGSLAPFILLSMRAL